MCVQYWPAGKNKEEAYSGVYVMVENEEQIANFMIRTIRLRKVKYLCFYLRGTLCYIKKLKLFKGLAIIF